MKIIITRHGETHENIAGIIQGHQPGKLTQNGRTQAKKLAQRLQNEKIDVIYASDLLRAASTARSIAKFHIDVPLLYTEELRERNMGEFQGKKISEIVPENSAKNALLVDCTDGESLDEMFRRAKTFLTHIINKHNSESTILLVSHGMFGKAMVGFLNNKTEENFTDIENMKNTSVSIFYKEDENIRMSRYNCVRHIK